MSSDEKNKLTNSRTNPKHTLKQKVKIEKNVKKTEREMLGNNIYKISNI